MHRAEGRISRQSNGVTTGYVFQLAIKNSRNFGFWLNIIRTIQDVHVLQNMCTRLATTPPPPARLPSLVQYLKLIVTEQLIRMAYDTRCFILFNTQFRIQFSAIYSPQCISSNKKWNALGFKACRAPLWFLEDDKLYQTVIPYRLRFPTPDPTVPRSKVVYKQTDDVLIRDARGILSPEDYHRLGFTFAEFDNERMFEDCGDFEKVQQLYMRGLKQLLSNFFHTPHIAFLDHIARRLSWKQIYQDRIGLT